MLNRPIPDERPEPSKPYKVTILVGPGVVKLQLKDGNKEFQMTLCGHQALQFGVDVLTAAHLANNLMDETK